MTKTKDLKEIYGEAISPVTSRLIDYLKKDENAWLIEGLMMTEKDNKPAQIFKIVVLFYSFMVDEAIKNHSSHDKN